MRDSFPLI
jgi:hypothetical protein